MFLLLTIKTQKIISFWSFNMFEALGNYFYTNPMESKTGAFI